MDTTTWETYRYFEEESLPPSGQSRYKESREDTPSLRGPLITATTPAVNPNLSTPPPVLLSSHTARLALRCPGHNCSLSLIFVKCEIVIAMEQLMELAMIDLIYSQELFC